MCSFVRKDLYQPPYPFYDRNWGLAGSEFGRERELGVLRGPIISDLLQALQIVEPDNMPALAADSIGPYSCLVDDPTTQWIRQTLRYFIIAQPEARTSPISIIE